MDEKPSILFLIILGVVGTALFSVFIVAGVPAVVFVIPLAILATVLHDLDAGITVGSAIALLNGIVIHTLRDWNIIVYALAAGITVVGLQATYPNEKPLRAALLFAFLGSLLVILIQDIYAEENILFRQELFAGTFALAAHVIAANVIITWIGYTFWAYPKNNRV